MSQYTAQYLIRKSVAHKYIWQQRDWPALGFDSAGMAERLRLARLEQEKVLWQLRATGLLADAGVLGDIWTEEAMATAAIEGEKLDLGAVRSSVMRRLGVTDETDGRVNRNVDGLLDVMHDATKSFRDSLGDDRLYRWHSALFPGGTSGIRRVAVGRYRDMDDPMQIVSGPVGRETVHYEAPPSSEVPKEMHRFIVWWEETRPRHQATFSVDGIARAAIAHLWFETIHPFEDGNGRIGRALVDMALAQDADSPQRYCGLSRQLMAQRDAYYNSLNAGQTGSLDVTPWVAFFVEQFTLACKTSQQVVEAAVERSRFWTDHSQFDWNPRQRKAVKRMLDAGKGGFEGGMSADKYANLTGASKATATRDLRALHKAGLLSVIGQGRATRYWVNLPGWSTEETAT